MPTISRHRGILEEKGEVWWGWWSKQGESVPRETLAGLQDDIEEDGSKDVYLVDSGDIELWRATVTDIETSDSSRGISSPEPELTPEYYAGRECLAWFQFSAIEPVVDAEDEIQEWSYDEVEEFFEDPEEAVGSSTVLIKSGFIV